MCDNFFLLSFDFFLSFLLLSTFICVSFVCLFALWLGVRHSTYRDARGVAHSYFFSWEHGPTRNLEVDWLDARNICRRHCMDAVSLETPQVSARIRNKKKTIEKPLTIQMETFTQFTMHTIDWVLFFLHRKMSLLNKELHVVMFVISGHRDVNVTLPVVIEQIYSHQMKMAGFGLVLVLKLVSSYFYRV